MAPGPDTAQAGSRGPLAGLKVVEMAGLGPAPMCAMLLADLGATVIRVDRKVPAMDLGLKRPRRFDLLLRNRDVIGVDLKQAAGVELVLDLVERADVLIEGFRPGVMERLGLGPSACLARNPRLVFGRVTGWGQAGPLAQAAGHDLNYVSLTGLIHALGRKNEAPMVPLSVIGDFGGGALFLALGILSALHEMRQSGHGQVVDAAMVDGVNMMQTLFLGLHAAGMWNLERGTNFVDSGSHFYEVYECADGKWVSVAAVEERFHDELLALLGIDPEELGDRMDPSNWPRAKTLLAERFHQRTRDEWCQAMEGSDACFAPVLTWAEAPEHPHMKQRGSFCKVDGVVQPAPAPRFSRTPAAFPTPPSDISTAGNDEALEKWLPVDAIRAFRAGGIID